MRIAVLGGGINGLCVAWELAKKGHEITLYERDELLGATSSTSTKLLHGGLRYLEQGAFSLVKEALHERAWWLENAPHIAKPLQILFPVYKSQGKPRIMIKAGLWLYDHLAGKKNIAKHTWCDLETIKNNNPTLDIQDMKGGYLFYDAQMDDFMLGQWVVEKVESFGVELRTHTPIEKINTSGSVFLQSGKEEKYDRVINVTGPWAETLLNKSGIDSRIKLDLVRGSHLLLDGTVSRGYFLQHPEDGRVFFVLPYEGQILLGTTEVRQTINEPNQCSDQEIEYLLKGYNNCFLDKKNADDIVNMFSGMRPLLYTSDNPNKASREYELERKDDLITVWGGKWTTARALAKRVVTLAT